MGIFASGSQDGLSPGVGEPLPELGGAGGPGADSLANALSAYGASAQNRQAAQINAPTGANPAALAAQQQGMAALQAQANGTAPSAAGIGQSAAINQGLGAAFAAQRGGAMGAGAQLGGMGAGAIGQGGAGAAQQQLAAQHAIMQGQGAMTGQAIQQQQQDQQVALAQAQNQLAQQGSNNQAQLGYQNLATNALLAQLQSDTSQQTGAIGGNAQLAVQGIGQNAQNFGNVVAGGAQAGGAGLSLAQNYWNQPQQQAPNADTGMTDQQENGY